MTLVYWEKTFAIHWTDKELMYRFLKNKKQKNGQKYKQAIHGRKDAIC